MPRPPLEDALTPRHRPDRAHHCERHPGSLQPRPLLHVNLAERLGPWIQPATPLELRSLILPETAAERAGAEHAPAATPLLVPECNDRQGPLTPTGPLDGLQAADDAERAVVASTAGHGVEV